MALVVELRLGAIGCEWWGSCERIRLMILTTMMLTIRNGSLIGTKAMNLILIVINMIRSFWRLRVGRGVGILGLSIACTVVFVLIVVMMMMIVVSIVLTSVPLSATQFSRVTRLDDGNSSVLVSIDTSLSSLMSSIVLTVIVLLTS